MTPARIPERVLEDIRQRYRVSDTARTLTKLRRAGGEFVGLCPFHKEKSPSFTVNDAKGFAHCFGCGFHGDVFALVTESTGCDFITAVSQFEDVSEWIVKAERQERLPDPSWRPADPVALQRERREDDERDARNAEAARRFWSEAQPVAGTPADEYLTRRGISVRPAALRFGNVPSYFDEERGEWGPARPALLAAIHRRGDLCGIQRIFLSADGRKADMRNPKRTLGAVRGGHVHLGPVKPDVMVCGSPEDGLTIFQQRGGVVPVAISCGEAMMPYIELPRLTSNVIIARQNDAPGEKAAIRADEEFREQGRRVSHIAPGYDFADWNDELLGILLDRPWKPHKFFSPRAKKRLR